MTEIVIVHFTDIHGQIHGYDYLLKNNCGSLSRLNNYMKNIRQKYDDVFLFDCGDLIQGGPLIDLLNKEEIKLLANEYQKLEVDVAIVGNHEFNKGLDHLSNWINNTNTKFISSNLIFPKNINVSNEIISLKTKSGFEINVMGLTTHYISRWEPEKNIAGMKINNPLDVFENSKTDLKGNYNIVLYHGGINYDNEKKELISVNDDENQAEFLTGENVDLLLIGHQHQKLNLKINGSSIVENLPNCMTISKTILTIDKNNKLISEDIEFVNIADIKNDDDFAKTLEYKCIELEKKLNTKILSLNEKIDYSDFNETRMKKSFIPNIINKAQLWKTNADLSVTTITGNTKEIPKDFYIKDLYRIYPYTNNLVVKKLKGSDIIRSLEVSSNFFEFNDDKYIFSNKFISPQNRTYLYQIYEGIDYEFKYLNDKMTLLNVFINGKEIEPEKKYTVAMSDYFANGPLYYEFLRDCELVNTHHEDVRDIIIEYINNSSSIEEELKNIINEKRIIN